MTFAKLSAIVLPAGNYDAGGFMNSTIKKLTDVVPGDDVPVAELNSSKLKMQPLLSPLVRTYSEITFKILSRNDIFLLTVTHIETSFLSFKIHI